VACAVAGAGEDAAMTMAVDGDEGGATAVGARVSASGKAEPLSVKLASSRSRKLWKVRTIDQISLIRERFDLHSHTAHYFLNWLLDDQYKMTVILPKYVNFLRENIFLSFLFLSGRFIGG